MWAITGYITVEACNTQRLLPIRSPEEIPHVHSISTTGKQYNTKPSAKDSNLAKIHHSLVFDGHKRMIVLQNFNGPS
jgi:hypothetical protein